MNLEIFICDSNIWAHLAHFVSTSTLIHTKFPMCFLTTHNSTIKIIDVVFFLVLFCWEWVLLWNYGCPGIDYVDNSCLILREICMFLYPQVLEFIATMHDRKKIIVLIPEGKAYLSDLHWNENILTRQRSGRLFAQYQIFRVPELRSP